MLQQSLSSLCPTNRITLNIFVYIHWESTLFHQIFQYSTDTMRRLIRSLSFVWWASVATAGDVVVTWWWRGGDVMWANTTKGSIYVSLPVSTFSIVTSGLCLFLLHCSIPLSLTIFIRNSLQPPPVLLLYYSSVTLVNFSEKYIREVIYDFKQELHCHWDASSFIRLLMRERKKRKKRDKERASDSMLGSTVSVILPNYFFFLLFSKNVLSACRIEPFQGQPYCFQPQRNTKGLSILSSCGQRHQTLDLIFIFRWLFLGDLFLSFLLK